jgi:hypothetical protein
MLRVPLDHALEISLEVRVEIKRKSRFAVEIRLIDRDAVGVQPLRRFRAGIHHRHHVQAFGGRVADEGVEFGPVEAVILRLDVPPIDGDYVALVPGPSFAAQRLAPDSPDSGVIRLICPAHGGGEHY